MAQMINHWDRLGGRHHRVTVRVPATSANLGPAFDCLGLALQIYNTVTVSIVDSPDGGVVNLEIAGEGSRYLPRNHKNIVWRALELGLRRNRAPLPAMAIRCCNNIPMNRGLGSSAAAWIAGLTLGNYIGGQALSPEQIVAEAAYQEGHPDNVSAAFHGGLVLSVPADDNDSASPKFIFDKPKIDDDWRAILYIPERPVSTRESRQLLPRRVPMEDAVFNIAHTALLLRALGSGDQGLLMAALRDRLHQPYRLQGDETYDRLVQLSKELSLPEPVLSGSGSTLISLYHGNPEQGVTNEIRARIGSLMLPVQIQVKVVDIDTKGAYLYTHE